MPHINWMCVWTVVPVGTEKITTLTLFSHHNVQCPCISVLITANLHYSLGECQTFKRTLDLLILEL